MHGWQIRNNVPGSVPPITPSTPRCFIPNPPPTPVIAPHRSPWMAGQPVIPILTRIPCVQFQPVEGGLSNINLSRRRPLTSLPSKNWRNFLIILPHTMMPLLDSVPLTWSWMCTWMLPIYLSPMHAVELAAFSLWDGPLKRAIPSN